MRKATYLLMLLYAVAAFNCASTGSAAQDEKARPTKGGGGWNEKAELRPAARFVLGENSVWRYLDTVFSGPSKRVEVDLGGEVIQGRLLSFDPKKRLSVRVDGLELGAARRLAQIVGIPLAGQIDGALELETTPTHLERYRGEIEFSATQIVLKSASFDVGEPLRFIDTPTTHFSEIELVATLERTEEGALLSIDRLTGDGPDLRFEAWGRIEFPVAGGPAVADIEARFMAEAGYVNRNHLAPILQLQRLREAKNEDHWYGFEINGTLAEPSIEPSLKAASGREAR